MKPVIWLGDSLARVRLFPAAARRLSGYQLEQVQAGKEPWNWRAMPSIGLGVNEIRVRAAAAFRLIYVVNFREAIYVLHAFQKKSRKTSRVDVDLARRRFRALIEERRRQ